MFDPDSRYAPLSTAKKVGPDGREHVYVTRRFLPRGDRMTTLLEVAVAAGDRLDLIATRVLGDPLQYFRICDANEAMDPHELTAEPDTRLRVAVPTTAP